ncbi:hypothetical protein IFR23_06420 [Sphingomonas sp. CFBP 13603]|uniref:HEPN domain-containing protein n=1 Tax=Sphingomonas sp. CFBP 13603 TaxID=2774040 RepID=UPI0018668C8B|nr:HEPN domain-containing protein [Sphingomonas sp. CFBP 13603]MBE2991649.1 hypothetical protein [Sphingomonas sp. CFBP 13603]
MTAALDQEMKSFLFDLKRNHLFLTLEARIKNPASKRSRPRSETLLSAYVTLTCGRFESFLKRSFHECAGELNQRFPDAKDDRLGQQFYWNNLNGFINWSSRAKGIDRIEMISMIENYTSAVAGGNIHPKSFDSTDANPNAETLKKMFNRFGVADPIQKLASNYSDTLNRTFSKSLIESNLNTFVRRRNQAAHEGRISGATRVDIQGDHVFVVGIAAAVKDVLTSHIAAL